jgi:hypothetical protein
MSEYKQGFYDGVLISLGVLAAADQPTLAQDIVNEVNVDVLFSRADEYDLTVLKKLGIKPSRAVSA